MNTFIQILTIAGIVTMSTVSCTTICHYFCNIISKTIFPKKLFFLGLIIMMPCNIITQLITLYFPTLNILKPALTILFVILISIFIYKLNILKGILCGFCCLILSAILDTTFSILLMSLNFEISKIIVTPLYYFLFSIIFNMMQIIVPIIIYLLLKNMHYFNRKYRDDLNGITIDCKYIFCQLIIILICLLPSMFLIFLETYHYPISFLIINTIQISVATCVGFIYTKKCITYKQTEQELVNTKLYNNTLASINENVRGFKHDMSNIVQAINGYISINNLDGVKEYCQGLLKGFNDINILSILSPCVINNPAIYGIVVAKILLAREKNIVLSLDINCDVNGINFPKFELSRILGILLDNAIEACEISNDKKLILTMYFDAKKRSDIIIIGNSVRDTGIINITKMFSKDYSTKDEPSGFGLYEVIKFFRKYDKGDIVSNINYEKNLFTQTLIFKK